MAVIYSVQNAIIQSILQACNHDSYQDYHKVSNIVYNIADFITILLYCLLLILFYVKLLYYYLTLTQP